ncbi:hypothetical protein LCGC14_3035080, partial [marine sediment metagenome]
MSTIDKICNVSHILIALEPITNNKSIIGDLSACGYDAEWNRLSAAAVGAPHLRERVFIVAHSISGAGGGQRRIFEDPQGQGWGTSEAGPTSLQPEGRQAHHPNTESPSEVVAHPLSKRHDGSLPPRTPREARGTALERHSDETLADPDNQRPQGRERRVLQERPCERSTGESGASGADDGYWAVEPDVGGSSDGFPVWLDRHVGKGMNHAESLGAVKALQAMWG